MGDLERIRALIDSTNPYGPALGVVNSINYTPTRAGQEGTALGVGIGKALLAGLLAGKSNARATEQMELVNQAIPIIARDPTQALSIEDLNPRVAAELQQVFLNNAIESQAKTRDLLSSEVLKKKLEIVAEDPALRSQYLDNPGRLLTEDIFPAMVEKAPEQPLAAVLADKRESDVAARSEVPSEAELRAQGYTSKEAREEIDRQRKTGREGDQDELTYQNRFLGLKPVEDYSYKLEGSQAFMEALKDPSDVSNFEVIRRAAQAVEPGLAVRQDDQDSLTKAASVLEVSKATLDKMIFGGSELSEDQRRAMARIVQRSFESTRKAYEPLYEQFYKKAEKQGFDPNFVTLYGPAKKWEDMFSDQDISSAAKLNTEIGPRSLSKPERKEAPAPISFDPASVNGSDAKLEALLKMRGLR